MLKKIWWISFALAFLTRCTDDIVVKSRGSLDWDFFPLEVNSIYTYSVIRINYLGRWVSPEEDQFLQREEIISQQSFDDGSKLFTVRQSTQDTSGDWITTGYFTIRKEFYSAISTIDNINTVELKLPLLDGYRWEGRSASAPCPDGGDYCDYFEVAGRGKEFTAGGILYPSTVRIVRQNTLDPLQITADYIEFAIYAQDIGLVYFEKKVLEYASCRNGQNPDCCCPDNILCTLCSGEIEFGVIEKKTLLERIVPN